MLAENYIPHCSGKYSQHACVNSAYLYRYNNKIEWKRERERDE